MVDPRRARKPLCRGTRATQVGSPRTWTISSIRQLKLPPAQGGFLVFAGVVRTRLARGRRRNSSLSCAGHRSRPLPAIPRRIAASLPSRCGLSFHHLSPRSESSSGTTHNAVAHFRCRASSLHVGASTRYRHESRKTMSTRTIQQALDISDWHPWTCA